MTTTRLFWWSPLHSFELLRPQMRHFSRNWLHLAALTRRPFLNFGDELSPLVWSAATGAKVTWSSPDKADVSAIGSILQYSNFANRSTKIWGSGFHHDPGADVHVTPDRVLAARGPLTAVALGVPHIAQGDPGLLSHLVVDRVPEARRQGTIFIPHFHTWGSEIGRSSLARAKQAGITVVPPSVHPKAVLEKIAGSELVLSSSLHGVIVAHSLGVPAVLLSITRGGESDFKYRDYYGALEKDFAFSTLEDYLATPAPLKDEAFRTAPEFEEATHRLSPALIAAARQGL